MNIEKLVKHLKEFTLDEIEIIAKENNIQEITLEIIRELV